MSQFSRWPVRIGIIVALLLLWRLCAPERGPLRVGSWNIENYPKSTRQEAGAFALIKALGVAALGVQEITAPRRFGRHARKVLGASWRFVYATPSPEQRVGVLFNSSALELLSTRTYPELATYKHGKPAFEARLERRDGRGVLRMLVVHLRATSDGEAERQKQLGVLATIIRRAQHGREQLVVVGDFNATNPGDRQRIESLARQAKMTWATRTLECSAYWKREDGCFGSRLDHILTWAPPREVTARGPCETEGCDPGQSCPIFFHDVSDHCPVVVTLSTH